MNIFIGEFVKKNGLEGLIFDYDPSAHLIGIHDSKNPKNNIHWMYGVEQPYIQFKNEDEFHNVGRMMAQLFGLRIEILKDFLGAIPGWAPFKIVK